MKIFMDTEFTGLHKNTKLINIGLISEDGRSFYGELNDYGEVNDSWLLENVIDNLLYGTEYFYVVADRTVYGNKKEVSYALKDWLQQFEEVEIWSDCLAYDWVLFNDLFDHAFNLPSNIYYIPFDICTLMKIKGVEPDISREEFIQNPITGKKHNSIYDARVIRACYDKLMTLDNKEFIVDELSKDKPIKEISVQDFRDTGLLTQINLLLHQYGLSIAVDNKNQRLYPARCYYRGFSQESIEKSYKKLNNYMKTNINIISKDLED